MTPGAGSRPLRILVVNWLDRENPQAGGAEEHLHSVFGRLAERGHQVTALVSGWRGCAPRVRLDGIDVHRVGGRYTFSWHGPRYYSRELASRPFDVIVEDLNKVPLYTPRWSDTPVILLVHHLFGVTAFQAATPPVAAVTWTLEQTIAKAFASVPIVAVSEGTKGELVAKGVDPDQVEVIRNGIDVSWYSPDPSVPKAVEPTLLFLGRLKKYKRVDLLLEAVGRLADEGLRVRLVVGGAGDQSEGLKRLAIRRGIADQVDFTGFISDELKLDHLRTSWIHVLASSKEGWGISNIEAGACGTPTIASNSPGLRESVIDGTTGLLVPHGDVGALSNAIRALVEDPERRSEMGRNARRFAEELSWEQAANRFEVVIRRVVDPTDRG